MERCWSVSQRGDYQRERYCAVSSNVDLRLRNERERERKCHCVSTTVVKAGISKRPWGGGGAIKEESTELKLMHVERHLQFDSFLAEIVTSGGRLKQPFRSLVSHYSTLM